MHRMAIGCLVMLNLATWSGVRSFALGSDVTVTNYSWLQLKPEMITVSFLGQTTGCINGYGDTILQQLMFYGKPVRPGSLVEVR